MTEGSGDDPGLPGPSRSDISTQPGGTSPLSLSELRELLSGEEPTVPSPKLVPALVATLLLDGRESADYKRRALAGTVLAKIESADVLRPYCRHVVVTLKEWLQTDLADTESLFADQYSAPKQTLGEALVEVLTTVVRSSPSDMTAYTPVLLAYLLDERGEVEQVLVALEAIVDAEPAAIPSAQLARVFDTADPYRIAAGARLLQTLAAHGQADAVLDRISFDSLELALTHLDSDVSGAAARTLADLAEAGYTGRIVAEIDISAFESPLQQQATDSCVTATAALCEIVAAGYTSPVATQLDMATLNSTLEDPQPNAVGNTAIVIGYLLDEEQDRAVHLADDIDHETLAELLSHESEFVRENVASALGYLLEYVDAGTVGSAISPRDLEPLVTNGDPSVAGNAVALLNELFAAGYIDPVLAEFDLVKISTALSQKDPIPRGNAVATIGYLAEHGYGGAVLDTIPLSDLAAELDAEADHVRGNAAASLADLAEVGCADAVIAATDLEILTALFEASDPSVVENAILAVGNLAYSGYADDLAPHIEPERLTKHLTHPDSEIAKNTATLIAAFSSRGCVELVFACVPALLSALDASSHPRTPAVVMALSHLCIGAPKSVIEYESANVLDELLTTATQTDLAYIMEIDPEERLLRTVVAAACHSIAVANPTIAADHQPSIRRLLSVPPYLERADNGTATTLLFATLHRIPSKSTIGPV